MKRNLHFFLFTLFLVVFKLSTQAQYIYHCGGSLIHCHGATGYVDAEDPAQEPMGITLAAWVRCEVNSPSNMAIVYRMFDAYGLVLTGAYWTTVQYGIVINSSGKFMFQAMIDTLKDNSNPSISYTTRGELDSLVSGVVPDSGIFYHVAVTLDPNSFLCNFYINGNIVASKTMKGPLHYSIDLRNPNNYGSNGNYIDASIGAKTYYIFNGQVATSQYFNGYLDDVVEANYALNKSQIDTIAKGQDLTATSYMNYHFSEGSGTATVSNPNISFNAINYGNTGYINGDVAWVNCNGGQAFANPGANIFIVMPKADTVLNGSASYTSASGAVISSYLWKQVSGPGQAVIANPNIAITAINSLKIGKYIFQLTVTDNQGNSNSANVEVTVQRAWADTDDSLALVDLYKNANGPNWTIGWTLSQPVMNWAGVNISLDSGRVTSLLLDYNNLADSIPASIVNLTDLTSLNISNNKLSFKGMEPLAQKFGGFAVYAPQDSILIDSSKGIFYAHAAYGTIGNNTYKWYKNGVLNVTTVGNPAYVPVDSAHYYVAVTNKIATQLTLYSKVMDYNLKPLYIDVAGLRIYADDIPPSGINPRIVSGNVRVVPKNGCVENLHGLHLAGNISVDTVNNTISGNDKIYCQDVQTVGRRVDLPYYNNYIFYVTNDVLTWNYTLRSVLVQNLFSLAFLNVNIKSLKVTCSGVQVSGEIELPKGVYYLDSNLKKDNYVKIDGIFIDTGGIKYAGEISVAGLTYKNLWGLDGFKLTYDYANDQFSVSTRLLAYLFNLDASATIKNSLLDEINFGIASGNGSTNFAIPLPEFPYLAIDSVGGGVKNLSDNSKVKDWIFGARIVPYLPEYTIPSLASLSISGRYQCGSIYSGKAAYKMFNSSKTISGSSTYTPGLWKLEGNLDLDFKLVTLKGNGEFSINSYAASNKLKGNVQLALQIPKIENPWLKFLNKLYPVGEYFSSSNYFNSDYFAGAAKLTDIFPRVFYIAKYISNWDADLKTNSSILPLEAQSELKLGITPPKQSTTHKANTLGANNPTTYSFSLNTFVESIVVSAKAASIPSLSMYLSNGDTLTSLNYQSRKNVLYVTDTLNGITTYIISNPPQGIYYVWSPDADSVHVSQINLAPKIVIAKTINDNISKKLTVDFKATAQNNNAFVLFGFDMDKSNADGIILQDSVPINGSSGTITLDYSNIKTGIYNLYSIITDSIGQSSIYYYDQQFKVIADPHLNPPTGLTVNSTDSSLIFSFNRIDSNTYNYLIHYQNDSGQININTPNFGIGDTNRIETNYFSPGKSYQFAVSALDKNNNESDISNIVTINWVSSKANNSPFINSIKSIYSIKAGNVFNISIPATDADGDVLTYSIIEGPANLQINNSGFINWNTDKTNSGYNRIGVKVSDGRGGEDSTFFTVLVYNSYMTTPLVSFDKPSYESYNETALVEISDIMQSEQKKVNVKIYSTSDPIGIIVPFVKASDNSSSFLSNILFSNTSSGGSSIKVAKGDTVWAQYSDTLSGQYVSNYALFSFLKADFLFKDSVCFSDTIEFYNSSKGTNLKYNWDFGDGTTSTDINPLHNFKMENEKSDFNVRLTVTNFLNKSDTITKTIHLIKAPPINISASGPVTFCEGDSILLSSNINNGIQWYKDSVVISSNFTNQLYVRQSGNYFVKFTDNHNCSANSDSIMVIVNPIPAAPIIIQKGDSIISNVSDSIVWYYGDSVINGIFSPVYYPNKPGLYTATQKINGCISNFSDTINFSNSSDSIKINGDTVSCLGQKKYTINHRDNIIINWSVSSGNFIEANDTSANVIFNIPGYDTVYVDIFENNTFTGKSFLVVKVNNVMQPPKPTIKLLNWVLYSSADSGNQWYRNDTLIKGATGKEYVPLKPGNYNVRVSTNDCLSELSNAYVMDESNLLNPNVSVFPNPTKNYVIILNKNLHLITIELFDILGKRRQLHEHIGGTTEIDLSNYQMGTYILLITDEATKKKAKVKIIKW